MRHPFAGLTTATPAELPELDLEHLAAGMDKLQPPDATTQAVGEEGGSKPTKLLNKKDPKLAIQS